MHDDTRIARLERSNRRLTIALVALAGIAGGAVLTGLTQPAAPAPAEWVGLALHDETGFLYRMDTNGGSNASASDAVASRAAAPPPRGSTSPSPPAPARPGRAE